MNILTILLIACSYLEYVYGGLKKEISRAGKMARPVKMLTAKPDDLSSNPRTHKVEGENGLFRVIV